MRNIRGFTLIEMMVSVAIFAIVVTSVSAAYLNLVNLDREARSTNDVVNNLSFATDSMARAIRTGTNYNCGSASGGNCAAPLPELVFTNSAGQEITYILTSAGQIGQCIGSGACNSATAVPFTDSRITISKLLFYVSGVGTADNKQPQVVFTIQGSLSDASTTNISFSMETSATQRNLDIP